MAARAKITAALHAPDRVIRTEIMADLMRTIEASEGACTYSQLTAAGFTEAEIEAYRDDARAILSDRGMTVFALAPGKLEGATLVAQARAIRARQAEVGCPTPV